MKESTTIIVDDNGTIKRIFGSQRSKPSQSSNNFYKETERFFEETGSESEKSAPLHWREVDEIGLQAAEKLELAYKKISKIIELKKEIKIYAKRAARWKRAALAHASFMGISGFIIGAMLMAKCILEDHGPTVTIHGTVIASLLCVGFGLLLGSVLAGVSIADAKNHFKKNKRKENRLEAKIAQTEEEINSLIRDVKKLHDNYVKGLKSSSSSKPHSGVAV